MPARLRRSLRPVAVEELQELDDLVVLQLAFGSDEVEGQLEPRTVVGMVLQRRAKVTMSERRARRAEVRGAVAAPC